MFIDVRIIATVLFLFFVWLSFSDESDYSIFGNALYFFLSIIGYLIFWIIYLI